MIEDQLLIRKCKRASEDALRRIYQKYKDDLLVLAMAVLNDATRAEDVLHDVFVRFVQDLAKFRLTGSLKGYLATCVANRARNINRQREAAGLEQAEAVGSDCCQPDEQIVCNEELELLNRAMAELSYQQREVIMLHLRSGLTFRQIAKSTEVSVNTAKSRYRYGIDKLRQILKERDEK